MSDLFDLPPRPAALANTITVESAPEPKRGRVRKTFRIYDGEIARLVELYGREAWALGALVHAGRGGCTPIDHPGPRWSDYVFKLRKRGFAIETIDEQHGGPYPGTHARYVLQQRVEFVNEGEGA